MTLAMDWASNVYAVARLRQDLQSVIQKVAPMFAESPRAYVECPILLHADAEQRPAIVSDDFDRSARHFVFRVVAVNGGVTISYFHNSKRLTSRET